MNRIRQCTLHAIHVSMLLLLLSASMAVTEPETIPDGYSVETIDIPDRITLEVGGLAFSSDGTLYITTRYGEVWLYRDGDWKLFADGLQQPLGIMLEDGGRRAYVAQKPELTKLVDTDGDRRAEKYLTVCDSWGYGDTHDYVYGPVRDEQGNFYLTLNTSAISKGNVRGSTMGRSSQDRGTMVKISPDGEMETYAWGLRSPAGISRSPDGEMFVTDNQGDWMPTSPLIHAKKGEFYGHPVSLADHPKFKDKNLDKVPVSTFKELRTDPVLWFPYSLAKSPGNPVFDTNKQEFGPFDGQMFVGDQTNSNVMRLDLERVKGKYQGVVFNFIDHLQCGAIRLAFGPDRGLWVGQTERGWQSKGPASYGLQRIVYDGETVPYSIRTIKLAKKGFTAHFTHPVDREAATNPDRYDITHWTYKYRAEYDTGPVDKQQAKVKSVQVSKDGRSVRFRLPEIQTSRVYEIQMDVPAKDGTKLTNNTGWYTVNRTK